jgi:aldose 1-epimerase
VRGPSGEQLEIEFQDQRAVVVEVGGGLRSYSLAGREVLDGYRSDEMCTSGRGQLLMPWPNRIEDGSYEHDGRRHQLPLTEPENRNAIHGLVQWVAWAVGEHDANRVVMEHVLRPQPGYPFTLALSVEYALSVDGLMVRTTATNVGSEAAPYGCGAHPYLTVGTKRVDSAILTLPAGTVLVSDARGIPVGARSVDGTEYDFRSQRPIAGTTLDHCFTDLERDGDGFVRVRLLDAETGTALALWADRSFPYLMVFTGDPLPDVDRRSLGVEPMTCPPNAFRTGEGLFRLEPGASHVGAWGISPALG